MLYSSPVVSLLYVHCLPILLSIPCAPFFSTCLSAALLVARHTRFQRHARANLVTALRSVLLPSTQTSDRPAIANPAHDDNSVSA
ncbi:hypothetical protein F5B21DRAFT_352515 [Xylaria acuta]|nr:hypothetical protein F5B21DRAFT_352515 [Xylaria acuta]